MRAAQSVGDGQRRSRTEGRLLVALTLASIVWLEVPEVFEDGPGHLSRGGTGDLLLLGLSCRGNGDGGSSPPGQIGAQDDPDGGGPADQIAEGTEGGAEQVNRLLHQIETGSEDERVRALQTLEGLDLEETAAIFVSALDNPSIYVREIACKVVTRYGRIEAVPKLLRVVKADPSVDVREGAAIALGTLAGPGRLEALLEAARTDPAPGVRRYATLSLAQVEQAEAVPPLAEALEPNSPNAEQDATVIDATIRTLGALKDPRAVRPLQEHFKASHRPEVLHALVEIEGARAAPFLEESFRSGEPYASIEPVPKLLLDLREPVSDRFLAGQAVRHTDPRARALIFEAAMSHDLPEVRIRGFVDAALEVLANDPDPKVREIAGKFISKSHPACDTKTLIALLESERERSVRVHLVSALAHIDEPEIVGLLERIAGSVDSGPVRMEAIRALGAMPDPQASSFLLQLLNLEKDPEMKRGLIQATARNDTPENAQLYLQLVRTSGSASVRQAAVVALEQQSVRPPPGLVLELYEAEQDTSVRVAWVELAATAGDPSLLPIIRKAQQDVDPRLVHAAEKALIELEKVGASPPNP